MGGNASVILMRYVILVHTMSDAFKIERILKKNEIKHKLIPAPRELSSDCGISVLVFEAENLESIISSVEYDKIVYNY